jgi:hypothetical protein
VPCPHGDMQGQRCPAPEAGIGEAAVTTTELLAAPETYSMTSNYWNGERLLPAAPLGGKIAPLIHGALIGARSSR